MSEAALLRCADVSAGFRGRVVVSGFDFTLMRGHFVLIRGPNGSGKSTILRTLFGLQPALGGVVEWYGGVALRPASLMRKGVRFLGQGLRGFGRMSTRRQLGVLSDLYGWARADVLTLPNNLMRRNIDALSIGQRRLAALATLGVGMPGVYLLDEPLAGLDQEAASSVLKWIKARRSEGVSIVMVEHRYEGGDFDATIDL